MKLVIIFGPQAVGKMTVGHELEKTTGLKLFHNHMTIELVSPFFNYGTKTGRKLVYTFRQKIFEEVAKSDLEWLIFTYVWAFNKKSDRDYIDKVCDIFESKWAEVYLIELEANVEERLKRNKTPHRLKHKPTKRDTQKSDEDLKQIMNEYRLTSHEWEIKRKNYMKIDNTDLSAEEVAEMIKNAIS